MTEKNYIFSVKSQMIEKETRTQIQLQDMLYYITNSFNDHTSDLYVDI